VSCIHLIKWTNNTHIGKGESLSNYLYVVSRAWASPSKWLTPEVFINVCIEWEQKKRNKSGHRCRLRSIIIRFSLTAFFFSFLLISFISEKSHRSFDVRCMHAHIVVIHINNIYLYVYRIVWWSLVNANRRLIICLSIDVHVILFGTKKN